MRENKVSWIGGTLTGLSGVALVRLLAPALAGTAHTVASVTGYLLVVAGIVILAGATRRKGARAFVRVEEEAKD
jgi:protein-S-isoprenylcysteine O-methyltransferase Ste14